MGYQMSDPDLISLFCVDEEKANRDYLYNRKNKYGVEMQATALCAVVLAPKRRELPKGFILLPPQGTSIEVLRGKYQKAYNKMKERGITHF